MASPLDMAPKSNFKLASFNIKLSFAYFLIIYCAVRPGESRYASSSFDYLKVIVDLISRSLSLSLVFSLSFKIL